MRIRFLRVAEADAATLRQWLFEKFGCEVTDTQVDECGRLIFLVEGNQAIVPEDNRLPGWQVEEVESHDLHPLEHA